MSKPYTVSINILQRNTSFRTNIFAGCSLYEQRELRGLYYFSDLSPHTKAQHITHYGHLLYREERFNAREVTSSGYRGSSGEGGDLGTCRGIAHRELRTR